MEWHVERRRWGAACLDHPCLGIATAVRWGVANAKLVVTLWIERVLSELRKMLAVEYATCLAFRETKSSYWVSELVLLCKQGVGAPEDGRLPSLQQYDQTRTSDHTSRAELQTQEKPFCGDVQLQVTIPSCLDNITLVGAVIKATCLTLSFSAQEAAQIELCVIEAVVNAIKHAYAGRSGHVVEIRVTTQADRLVLQVCDYGQAMVGEMLATLDFDPSDIAQVPEGGMGFFLMHSLMDEVSYASNQGTNILTMAKRLSTKHTDSEL